MTITREQVADLQPGDVVEVTDPVWLGSAVRGALVPSVPSEAGLALRLFSRRTGEDFQIIVRDSRGNPGEYGKHRTLTVISRAPRPLYVNDKRTEVAVGDVVRDEDWTVWLRDAFGKWQSAESENHNERPCPTGPLTLLVDGETNEVVR